MAIEPLFIADRATLLAKLRLTGTVSEDANAVIDEVVQKVRLAFYDELGATQVAYLKSITYVENPTTEADVLRAVANSCEVQWCRCWLLTDMPLIFLGTGTAAQEAWNTDGFTQQHAREDRKTHDAYRQEVCDGVYPMLDRLRPQPTEELSGINTAVIGNSLPWNKSGLSPGTSRLPFGSLRGGRIG